MRNLFIVGVSIFLGLSVPEYFFRYSMAAQRGPAHTKAGWVCPSLSPSSWLTYVANCSAFLNSTVTC